MTQAATFPVTGLPRTGLPARALVVGNPVHAERISRRLTGAQEVARVGAYRSFVGVWNGMPVLVVSHDIGAPGALCLLRDLSDAGVDTVIRLGIADALLRGIAEGDLIIAESCVRDAGLTSELVPESYPAAATPEVVLALAAAARERGAAHHRGVVWSRVASTPDGVEAGAAGYVKLGVLAVEEELAALLVLSSTRGVRWTTLSTGAPSLPWTPSRPFPPPTDRPAANSPAPRRAGRLTASIGGCTCSSEPCSTRCCRASAPGSVTTTWPAPGSSPCPRIRTSCAT
jgi:uridine phosphorylase